MSAMRFAAKFSTGNIPSGDKPFPVEKTNPPKKLTMNLQKHVVTQTMSDNSVYVGEWLHGTMNGKGTLVYLSGNIVEGNWFHGELSGDVKIRYRNGDTFEGSVFQNVVNEGKGVWRPLESEPSEFDYNGSWRNGMYDGIGMKKFEDGMIYKGEWVKNAKHGLGTCTFPDGTVFEGEFFADSREGVGRSCSPDGKVFLGVFSRNNIQSGRGYSLLSDGSIYEGEWAAGCKHGKGIYKLVDGTVYEGMWRKDHLHGPGKITTSTGEVIEGIFEAGVLIGPVGSKIQPALHKDAGLQQGMKYTQQNEVFHVINHSPVSISTMEVLIKPVAVAALSIPLTPVVQNVTTVNNINQGISTPRTVVIDTVRATLDSSTTTIVPKTTVVKKASTTMEAPTMAELATLKANNIANLTEGSSSISPTAVATAPTTTSVQKPKQPKPFHFTDKDCVYAGGMYNNQRHGHGSLTHSDGYTFQGEFLNGSMNGYGKWSHSNGDYVEGFYTNNQLNGQVSRLVNGESYEGEYVNNNAHGYGVSRDTVGTTYEGDFEHGLFHGYGTMKLTNGTVYSGDFEKGKMHGTGVLQQVNGEKYEGNFVDGVQSGAGKMTYPNGNVLTGVFKDGKIVSDKSIKSNDQKKAEKADTIQSKIKEQTNTEKVTSPIVMAVTPAAPESAQKEFFKSWMIKARKNLPKDSVQLTFADGHYTGQISSYNMRRGYGIMTYHDGCAYVGKWFDDQRSGNGFMLYVTNHERAGSYKGGWSADVYHGLGCLTTYVKETPDSITYTKHSYNGTYEHGVLCGAGKVMINNKVIYKGNFLNDQYHGTGVLKESDWTYQGEFVNGEKHGSGILIYHKSTDPSKSTLTPFKGIFVHNFPDTGTGTVMRPSGMFEGQLINGKEHGPGQFTSLEDKTVIIGEWVNGEILFGKKLDQKGKLLYEGPLRNLQPTGQGTLILSNKATYMGEIDEGQPHGAGVLTYDNNKTFEGHFAHGQVVTGHGYYQLSNQDSYEGKIVNGVPEGFGVYTIHPMGDILSGEFVNGSLVKGKMTSSNGLFVYEGEWKNNRYHGEGELKNSKYHYQGHFYKGQFDGSGTIKFLKPTFRKNDKVINMNNTSMNEHNPESVDVLSDSSKKDENQFYPAFTGKFKNGVPQEGNGYFRYSTHSFQGTIHNKKKHGECTVYHQDGTFQQGMFIDNFLVRGTKGKTKSPLRYSGLFDKMGKLIGTGKIVMFDGRMLEGEFQDDQLLSPGKITYRDKSVYEGEHKKLVRSGKGVFTATDGSVYKGNFSDDEMDGEGILIYPDGQKLEGTFQKGRLYNGKGLLRTNTGTYEGTWVDGKKTGTITYSHGPTNETFVGEYKDDILVNGAGKLSLNSMAIYVGEVRNSKMHGKGVVYNTVPVNAYSFISEAARASRNGHIDAKNNKWDTSFIGEFSEGMIKNGEGVYIFPYNVFEGTFVNGKRHGEAVITDKRAGRRELTFHLGDLQEGTGVKDKKFASFEGEFSNGILSQGSVVYPDGKRFTGVFRGKNIWQGSGLFRFADGTAYEGDWLQGVRHGRGIYYSHENEAFPVEYMNGALITGRGKIELRDGSVYFGDFVQGKRSGYGKLTMNGHVIFEGKWENDTPLYDEQSARSDL